MKEDRRSYARHQTMIKAQYYLKDRKEEWVECVILDVSSKGLGITFSAQEKIETGSTVLLEIPVIEGLEPINIAGVLKWIEKKGNEFIGGIESTEIFDAAKLYQSPLEK
jgi:hypothetical protein